MGTFSHKPPKSTSDYPSILVLIDPKPVQSSEIFKCQEKHRIKEKKCACLEKMTHTVFLARVSPFYIDDQKAVTTTWGSLLGHPKALTLISLSISSVQKPNLLM